MEEVKKKTQTKKPVSKNKNVSSTAKKSTSVKKVQSTKSKVTTTSKSSEKKPASKKTPVKKITAVKTTQDKKPVVDEKITKEDGLEEIKSVVNEEIKKENKKEKRKKDKGKKILVYIIFLLIAVIAGLLVYILVINKNSNNKGNNPHNEKLLKLPKPEVDSGERGKLGIDKNINEKSIDKYLGRRDAVYRDMRMLSDPGNYEAIGGDSYLSGYIDGFEVVPLPYIIPVKNLPKEVGYTYSGTTLFFQTSDGKYHAMFKESMDIIEELFPKDKVIFLMCGGGGYAGMMKEFLVSQGWNKDKIYVVGGYWYYNGKNKIEVPKKGYGDYAEYDFSSVPYHDIDFSVLTAVKKDRHTGSVTKFYLDDEYYKAKDDIYENMINKYDNFYSNVYDGSKELTEEDYDKFDEEFRDLSSNIASYINNLVNKEKTFVVSVYNSSGCGDSEASVAYRSKDYSKENDIYFYLVPSDIIYETDLYKDVQEYPNVIIVKEGKVYTYLDHSSDDDADIFESDKALIKWLNKYIYISK